MTTEPTPRRTARDVLSALSPEARQLAQAVTQLEREHLHYRDPSQVVPGIVDEVKRLIK